MKPICCICDLNSTLLNFFYYQQELHESFLSAIWLGPLSGVMIALQGSALFPHFVLSFLLQKEGKAPFRMAQFYDYCADLRLLEKDGGTWRFRHQIIHDYFKKEVS